MPSPATLRDATPDDALAIATVRVAGWRTAYLGLVPQEMLDALDPDDEAVRRRERWGERHAHPHDAELVAEVDGDVVGWAVAGRSRDEGHAGGELYGLYVLPEHWSTGVGHLLLTEVETRLRSFGYAVAHLWVLDGNERAAGFYERHGWAEDGGVQRDERGPYVLHERRRVRRLAGAVPRDQSPDS